MLSVPSASQRPLQVVPLEPVARVHLAPEVLRRRASRGARRCAARTRRSRSRAPRAGTGSSPRPLSTDTTWSVGCRSSTPDSSRFPMVRKFEIITSSEPSASLRSSSSEGQGMLPSQLIDVLLAPMWKFTGMARSAHASQSGSQCRSARSGYPWFCGSALVLMPRSPERVDRAPPRRRRRRGPTTAGSPSGTCDRPTPPGTRPSRRCRSSRTATSASGRRRRRTAGHRSPTTFGYTICA